MAMILWLLICVPLPDDFPKPCDLRYELSGNAVLWTAHTPAGEKFLGGPSRTVHQDYTETYLGICKNERLRVVQK